MALPLTRHLLVRAAKLLVFAAMVPIVLLLAQCVRGTEHQADQGRRWCEGVIAIFESDRPGFLRQHAKQIHHGMLVVRPTGEPGPASADFVVKRTGDFVCRYWFGGVIFPQGRQYTSKRRRWVSID